MGRRSKAKGSFYEREFVRLVQDYGLPAERRYGSQECDDIRVADTWRVECKYRANGSGFKRLYSLLGAYDWITVGGLLVMRFGEWAVRRLCEVDEVPQLEGSGAHHMGNHAFATLRKWKGEADYLAVRMPREDWLVVEVL